MFQMGGKFGAVSFLQIAAPELSDRMLADFMEAENGIEMCIRDSVAP